MWGLWIVIVLVTILSIMPETVCHGEDGVMQLRSAAEFERFVSGLLGHANSSSILFVDLDETVVAKKTCISYEFYHTNRWVEAIYEHCLDNSKECRKRCESLLESRYYSSQSLISSSRLAEYLFHLQHLSHKDSIPLTVIGLTSNRFYSHYSKSDLHSFAVSVHDPETMEQQRQSWKADHVETILQLMSQTALGQSHNTSWFTPLSRINDTSAGTSELELPNTLAEVRDLSSLGIGTVIFRGCDKEDGRAASRNKGAIIHEYLQTLWTTEPRDCIHAAGSKFSPEYHTLDGEQHVLNVVLLDDTLRKVRAAKDFLLSTGLYDVPARSSVPAAAEETAFVSPVGPSDTIIQRTDRSRRRRVFLPLWYTEVIDRLDEETCTKRELLDIFGRHMNASKHVHDTEHGIHHPDISEDQWSCIQTLLS